VAVGIAGGKLLHRAILAVVAQAIRKLRSPHVAASRWQARRPDQMRRFGDNVHYVKQSRHE
ncbi:hypothetical protein ACXWO8_09945, partial [Streptococcus pyogenes]